MNVHVNGRYLVAVACLLALTLTMPAVTGAQQAMSEVLLEGGAVEPRGDLGDSWYSPTGRGFGAEAGYEVGFRFRYFASPSIALSPSFHYVDFANFLGVDEQGSGFEVQTSILRYAMDLNLYMGTPQSKLRPFFTMGAVLFNNKYQDFLEADQSTYKTSVYNLGGAAGGGIRVGIFEISAIYNYNRFATVRLDSEGRKRAYNWDYVAVRAAIGFPTY